MMKFTAILAAAALAGLMAAEAGATSTKLTVPEGRIDYYSPYAKALRAAARKECNDIRKYPDGAQPVINYRNGWFRCDWKSGKTTRDGRKNR